MRDLLSKVMTSSMVAGAALLVAACGGGEEAEANNTMNYTTDDALMTNDVTTVDAMNGTDANLGAGVDGNLTIDANTVTVDTNTVVTPTDANTTGM